MSQCPNCGASTKIPTGSHCPRCYPPAEMFERSDPEDPSNAYDLSRQKFNCTGRRIKE